MVIYSSFQRECSCKSHHTIAICERYTRSLCAAWKQGLNLLPCLGDTWQVEIIERDKAWAEEKKMGCFLGVSQGSDEPLRFLEMHYKGAGDSSQPVVLVGKGVTFDSCVSPALFTCLAGSNRPPASARWPLAQDPNSVRYSGGISIKPSGDMGLMRGDMSGAATVSSALLAAATLGVRRNVVVLAPLCENMPSGKATRPGDILTAMNGVTVEVRTDLAGTQVGVKD